LHNNIFIYRSQVSVNVAFGPLYGLASKTVNNIVYYLAVDENGYIYGAKGNGTQWSAVSSTIVGLNGVTIGSNGNAYVCGASARVYCSSYSTSSAFATWTDVSPSLASDTFYAVSTYDGINVIAVGGTGSIYYSSDSASTWTSASSGTTGIINCISHGSSSFAISAGQNSYVARTSDSGATWTIMSVFSASTVFIRFQAVSVLSTSQAFVAGNNGEIWRTLDGGTSWKRVTSTGSTLFSIGMYDLLTGVAGATAGSGVYTLVPGMFIFV
jgi:photosystem II stability/assembly factor-like uncharacterized protein